ncbi:hypothetical protein FGO68_gene10377 [Halteria grandinella]|uniref:Transmembrane protein n=1 Tax=Halteria grandinella TaxID=5974 RepID=A0A8J8TAA4_HALGN|nr:hypothetical protein FGO68_gene10377 [Halteria grandinella]
MRNSKNLEKYSVKRIYGFLYNGYKQGFSQYWEIIIIYRKVLLIFIQIFIIQQGKISQALFTLLFLIVSIIMVRQLAPYSKSHLNTLEIISLLTSTASVYFGIFFISNHMAALFEGSSYYQVQLTKNQSLLIFISIVFVNVAFFAYWLFYFVMELRQSIRSKYPQVYIAIFLCCKKDKYIIHRELDEHHNRMKPIVNRITELIDYLNERKDMIEQGLLSQNDNEFKEKLIMFTQFKALDEKNKALMRRSPTKIEDLIKNKQSQQLQTQKSTTLVKIGTRHALLDEVYIDQEQEDPEKKKLCRMKASSANKLSLTLKGKRKTNLSLASSIAKKQSLKQRYSGQDDDNQDFSAKQSDGNEEEAANQEVNQCQGEATNASNEGEQRRLSLKQSGKKPKSLAQTTLPPINLGRNVRPSKIIVENNSEINLTSEHSKNSKELSSDHEQSESNQIIDNSSNFKNRDRLKSELIDNSIREDDSETQDFLMHQSEQRSQRNPFTSQARNFNNSKNPSLRSPMINDDQTQIPAPKKNSFISPIMNHSFRGKQHSFKVTTQRITSLDLGDQVSVQIVKQIKNPKSKELNERGRIRLKDSTRQNQQFITTNVSGSKQIQLEDVTIIDEEAPY